MRWGFDRSLFWTVCFLIPAAGWAVGLGDIRVNSALNERLSAQIEVVSATADELVALQAAVGSRELFERYGAERPGFLSSVHFKLAHDARGRSVLLATSTEPFTEPFVSLLVVLRWDKGELIREYPLLLDPSRAADVPSAPAEAVAAVRPTAAER